MHSFLVFLQAAGNSKHEPWNDETLIALLPEIVIGILGGGTRLFTSVPEIVHARECVRYVIRHGLVPLCRGEHSLRTLTESLVNMAKQTNANGTVIVVCLLEVSTLVGALGDSIEDIVEEMIDVVIKSVGRAGSPVRGSASLALRAIVAQFPANVPSLITQALQTIKVAQAEMSVGSDVKRQMDTMHGNSLALAALLAEIPNCDAGIPTEFMDSLLDFATNLLTNKSTESDLDVTVVQRQSGWNIIAGIVTGLETYWFETQLVPIVELWDEVLSKPKMAAMVNARSEEEQLCLSEIATHALAALRAFFARSLKQSSRCGSEILRSGAPFLDNVLEVLPSLMTAPATNQLRLKVLECYATMLPLVTQRPAAGVKVPYPDVLKVAMAQLGPGKHGTSVLRKMLNEEDVLLWGPQREDWFVPNDLDEFRLFAEDHMTVWNSSLQDALHVASVPTSLLICDTAIYVAGSTFSAAPELGEPYLDTILEKIKEMKKKPAKKKEAHTGMKMAFDLSKNAVGSLLKCFRDCAEEGRTIAHEGFLTKSMDLLSFLLLEDNAVIRCSAAEAFGLLARTAVDQFRKTCVNFLVNCMRNPKREPPVRGSFAFALGCVCRYTGEMWHPYMVDIIGTLQSGNQLPMPAVRVWTLFASSMALAHAQSVAAEYLPSMFRQAQLIVHAAEDLRAEAKVSYLVPTYTAMARLLRSTAEVVASSEREGLLGSITDNLGNDEMTVIAAELVGQVTEVREYPGVEAEYVAMLGGVLCAPGSLMDSVREELTELLPVKPLFYLRERLNSLRADVRMEAAKSVHAFVATTQPGRDAVESDIEVSLELLWGLFYFLDVQAAPGPDCVAVKAAKEAVDVIVRIHAAENSQKLLSVLRQVTLGLKAAPAVDDTPRDGDEGVEEEVAEPEIEDEPLQIGAPRNPRRARLEAITIGRWRTKLVSISGVQAILEELEGKPEHFDAKLAEEVQTDCIVSHLQELIGIASSAATSKFSGLRLKGLYLMKDIIHRFGDAEDPYMPGSRLLAQYNAQIGAALRGIFPADESRSRSTSALALVEVIGLISQYLLLGIVPASDAVALRRLIGLLMDPVNSDDLLSKLTGAQNFDDVTECRLVVCLHGAIARLHLAYADDDKHPISVSIGNSLSASLVSWIQLLRDFMRVAVYVETNRGGFFFKQGAPREQLVPVYEEHFTGVLLAALSLVGGPAWGAVTNAEEDIILLLGMAVAFLRGQIGPSEPSNEDVGKMVGVLGDVLASGIIDQVGLPTELLADLVQVVHTVATGTAAAPQVAGLLSKLVDVLPPALWESRENDSLLQAIVTAGCDAILEPLYNPSAEGEPPGAEAFGFLSSLSELLPAAEYLKTAACLLAMLLRAIDAEGLDASTAAAGLATLQKVIGAVVKAAAAEPGTVGEAGSLLKGGAVSALHCAQHTMNGQAEVSPQLLLGSPLKLSPQETLYCPQEGPRLTTQLEASVSLLQHLVALSRLPGAEDGGASQGVCQLLNTTVAKGLRHGAACVRSAALAVLVKLGQALAPTAAQGPLFASVLNCCGGVRSKALLGAVAQGF